MPASTIYDFTAIRRLRAERGWSQTDLAQRSGVPQNYISQLERGRRPRVSVPMVERVLAALDQALWVAPAPPARPSVPPPLERDPRTYEADELARLFPGKDGFSDRRFIQAALLWLHGAIQDQSEPPVDGNVSTIWYRYLRPALDRVDQGRNRMAGDVQVSRQLTYLTLEAGVVRAVDFGLTDAAWEQRRIGARRPGVIVYAEQTRWMRDLRRAHRELGVTVSCWEGQPSAVTSAYTAQHVSEAVPSRRVRLISLCDWDPSGDTIMGAYARHLEAFGLHVELNFRVVRPSLFSAEERARLTHALPEPKNMRRSNAAWLKRGGGVDGALRGLSSVHLDWDRLAPVVRAVAEDWSAHAV